ncbi:dual specificity protein kinase splB-like [Octopus sinensis]|uniref:Dual specificity protein kinase splB-like n=1 Tax=Octopus sinensis TaxID=2607531 RepID=A0A6P7TNI5_9MOLL|nr:dual specificity protein kinase splB-like [Octopus sinensis]XP_036369542.1 dual specificity protein kinase splB-like [Octopus sinensis]XP_036369543.1 dual specificity protein kinase splB-like [Octopus sinensis]
MARCENFSDFMDEQDKYKEKHFSVGGDDDDDDEEEDNLPLMSVKNNLHQTQMSALLRNSLENSAAGETEKYDNVTKNRDVEKKTANTIPSSTTINGVETQQSGSPKGLSTKQVIPAIIEAAPSLGNVTISPYISESTNNISSAINASVTTNPSATTAATDDDEATIFTTVSLATNTECNSTNAITNPTNSAVSSSSASPFSSFPGDPVTLTPTIGNGGSVQLGEETQKQSKDGAHPKPNDKGGKFLNANTTTVTTFANNNRPHCENLSVKTSGQRCVTSTKPKCKYHGLNSAPCRKLYKCKKCGLEAKCLSDIQAHMGGTHSEFCMYRCPYCVPRNRVKTINSIEFEVLRSSNTNVSSQSSVKKKTPYYTSNNNSTTTTTTTTSSTTTTTTTNNGKKKKVNHQIQLQREKKRKLNYYYRNQHEIKKYKNTKITCEYCRKLVNQSNISRHLNSKSCKGLKKNTEKQNVNDRERIVIKKYQKVKCNTCQKQISRTNLSKHCRICPKENLHN